MITLNLDPEQEKVARQLAHQMGISLSEFIQICGTNYLNNTVSEYGTFGRHSSGHENLSINRKALLKEKLQAKYNK